MVELTDADLDESGSQRTCIVTRRKGSPDELLRFVAAPDGAVVPDLKRKLPGRGVWVSADAKLVAEAVKKGLFARALRGKAQASAALADEVALLLERDALQAFSLANKAGAVVTGFAKVEKLIADQEVAGLVHARDAGADGVRKMGQALHRAFGAAGADVPQLRLFASDQLDLALGRSNVVHAAVKTGPAAGAFLMRALRLSRYRGEGALDGTELEE